jgi:pimeloyl-ACP methyl ester carboxylesterase
VKQSTHRSRATTWELIRRGLRILFLLYLTTAMGCAAIQRKMIYYPAVAESDILDQFAKSKGLERWNSADGKSIGWKRPALIQPALGQVLITHGNGCCAIQRLDFVNPLRESAGMEVFVLEYPGFGDRPGAPSESAMFAAAEDAFQSLPKTAPVYLVGESLGTAVAAHLAGAHPEVGGVLLFAPFNSLVDVAQHHLKVLPASWLMSDRFESEKYLKRYRGPLALVVGGKDQVVPEKFGRRLFDGYDGPKRLWQAPLATHNEVHAQSTAYWNEIITFWQTNAVVRVVSTPGVDSERSGIVGDNSLVRGER